MKALFVPALLVLGALLAFALFVFLIVRGGGDGP